MPNMSNEDELCRAQRIYEVTIRNSKKSLIRESKILLLLTIFRKIGRILRASDAT